MKKFLCASAGLVVLAACSSAPVTKDKETGSGSTALNYESVLELAQGGNHDAEFELGAMFHDGDGVEQDYAQALDWYKKSANAGNHQAAFNLALMYKNGEGTNENMEAARGWFVRASDAGDVRGAFQLGQMSYLGTGVAQDFDKAMQYYLKAANGGLAEAQMNVGVMNIRGEGIAEQNLIDGYAWLKLASDAGNERATSLLATLTEKLTPEMKKQGEDRAVALKKQVKASAGINAAK